MIRTRMIFSAIRRMRKLFFHGTRTVGTFRLTLKKYDTMTSRVMLRARHSHSDASGSIYPFLAILPQQTPLRRGVSGAHTAFRMRRSRTAWRAYATFPDDWNVSKRGNYSP